MNVFIGFILIIVGILNIAFPKAMWMISDGWKFRDAEPSDAAIAMHRFGGVVGIFIGIVAIFGM